MSALRQSLVPILLLASTVATAETPALLDPINLRQAKGVVVALYNESTGARYAKIHYEEFSKRPSRIGFLKVGFPILTLHELSLRLDAKQAKARVLLSAIEQMVNSRSSRYLFGENVTLLITDGKGDIFELRATKARFHARGLRFFGAVELSLPGKEHPLRRESIYLQADQEMNTLAFVTSSGNDLASIPLGDDSKLVSKSTPAAIKTQRR